MNKTALPIISFKSPKDWASWLAKNSAQSSGIWLRLFKKELSKNKKAKTFFETLNKANTYAIARRLQTAKRPETRAKRMQTILALLKRGEKLHD